MFRQFVEETVSRISCATVDAMIATGEHTKKEVKTLQKVRKLFEEEKKMCAKK